MVSPAPGDKELAPARLASTLASLLAPTLNSGDPSLAIEPRPEAGPVRVTIEFQVDPTKAEEFIEAAHQLSIIRRRDGAVRWGLFQDPYHPERFVESFLVDSWAEHLRQIERFTNADKATRDKVFSYHIGANPPAVTRMLYVKPGQAHMRTREAMEA